MPWISKARLKAMGQRIELAEGRAMAGWRSLRSAEGNIGKLQAELEDRRLYAVGADKAIDSLQAELMETKLRLDAARSEVSHGAIAAMRHEIQCLEVMLAKLREKYKAKIEDLRARLDSQEALAAIAAWEVPGHRSDG